MRSLYKPSLADVIKIHRNEGKKSVLTQAFVGEVDISLIDEKTGDVIKRVHQKNMATESLPAFIAGERQGLDNTWWYIFLSNDSRTMNIRSSTFKATYFDPMSYVSSSFTKNATGRIWTLNGTIPTPTSGHSRNFWYVGIHLENSASVVYTYGRSVRNVVAATKLTTMLTQNYGTLVQINYRLIFKRASDV